MSDELRELYLQPCPACGVDPDYTDPDPTFPTLHVFCGNLRCPERPHIVTSRGPQIAVHRWNQLR